MKIKGSTILVTGGASGLGNAVANRLNKQEANVVVLDLPKDENQKKAESIGKGVLFCAADITKSEEILHALESAQKRFGSIQAIINCAGIAFAAKTLKHGTPCDLKLFTKTLEVNLSGTYNVCRLAAAVLAQNTPSTDGERGVIINTASIAAFDGQMGQTAYAASKGGIVSLTLPLARDLSDLGIRVVTIAPGIFDTPMLALLPETARKSLAAQVPFPKRLGDPDEFAFLAQHILENSMLNGEVIRLDGALRMGIR